MEGSKSLADFSARVRRLRQYRLMANSFATLLAVALVLLLLRWISPWIFSVLVDVWSVDAVLLVVLAVPWLLVSLALARGRVACPACNGPFTSQFHLWVPRNCQKCAYDITGQSKGGPSNGR